MIFVLVYIMVISHPWCLNSTNGKAISLFLWNSKRSCLKTFKSYSKINKEVYKYDVWSSSSQQSSIKLSVTQVKKLKPWASLVAQWLRVCLLMQGTRVRALVWEDPTCRGAAGPVSHSCWACASGACAPQREGPRWWGARAPRWRAVPAPRWRVAPTCRS